MEALYINYIEDSYFATKIKIIYLGKEYIYYILYNIYYILFDLGKQVMIYYQFKKKTNEYDKCKI